MTRPTGERGFTLVEMLVALVLLGLVLGLLGGGARVLRGTGDRLAERSRVLGDVALFTALVHERLGDAVALEFGPAGRRAASFEGSADRLRFVTLAHEVQVGLPLVAMEIGAGPAGGVELALVELAADQTAFAPLDGQPAALRRQLLRDATAFSVRYFGRKEGEQPAWHDEWSGQPRLPRAVRFDLDLLRLDLAPVIVPVQQRIGPLCASQSVALACPEP